jgi:hypothetical protein
VELRVNPDRGSDARSLARASWSVFKEAGKKPEGSLLGRLLFFLQAKRFSWGKGRKNTREDGFVVGRSQL